MVQLNGLWTVFDAFGNGFVWDYNGKVIQRFVWDYNGKCDSTNLYGITMASVIQRICMGLQWQVWFNEFVWDYNGKCDSTNNLYGITMANNQCQCVVHRCARTLLYSLCMLSLARRKVCEQTPRRNWTVQNVRGITFCSSVRHVSILMSQRWRSLSPLSRIHLGSRKICCGIVDGKLRAAFEFFDVSGKEK